MTGLFLQCRLDSSRLPGKALLDLGGKPMIARVMEALRGVEARVKVLLTTDDSREKLLPCLEGTGFELFTGSKTDVLERFVMASRHYGVKNIVRATGDNPYVSHRLANEILADHIKKEADYSGYLGMPLGTGVEILAAEALETAYRESLDPYDHEHVAPYLYKNDKRFRINRPSIKERFGWEHIKISVDTPEDWELINRIYKETGKEFPLEIDRLMSWIKDYYG